MRRFLPVLMLLLTVACAKKGDGSWPSGMMELSVTIRSGVTGAQTRTSVADPDVQDGLQHVVGMYLYVFAGSGDDFVCKDVLELEWYNDNDVEILPTPEDGVVSRTRSYPFDVGKYTAGSSSVELWLVAVGVDGDGFSPKTYGIPGSVRKDETTLKEAVFRIAQSVTYTDGVAVSEFFTGAVHLTASSTSEIRINATRAVAGFLAYVNLPGNARYVAVKTSDVLNDAVPFLPEFTGMASLYGEGNLYSRRSGEPEYIDDRTVLYSEVPEGGSMVLQAYMLPVSFPVRYKDRSTLMLELYDETRALLGAYKIVHLDQSGGTRSGTGIIDPDDGNAEYNPYYHYPIVANHLYKAGSINDPVDLDGSTSEIEVTVDDIWDQYYGGNMGDYDGDSVDIDDDWGDYPGGELVE